MPDIAHAIKELQETAMSGIQSRQASLLKEHAEWLQAHDRAITEIRENGKKTDERIEKLVSAIGELIRNGK
jgi:hypothetical protein